MADLTPAELDILLERFDQTEPGLQRQIIGRLITRAIAAEAERDKLQAFKSWVHAWLDAAGVPHDPDPEHTAQHGCRISGRMRHLLTRATKSEAELAGINQWVNDEIKAKTESLQRSFVVEAERRMDAYIVLADMAAVARAARHYLGNNAQGPFLVGREAELAGHLEKAIRDAEKIINPHHQPKENDHAPATPPATRPADRPQPGDTNPHPA